MLIGRPRKYLIYQYESMIPKILKKNKRGRPRKDGQRGQTQAHETKAIPKQNQSDFNKMDIISFLTNSYEQEIAPGVRHLFDIDDAYYDYPKFLIRCNKRNKDERMTRSDKKWFEQTEELKRLWESYHPEKVLTIDDLKNAVNAQEEEEEEEVDDFDENDNESKDESSRHIKHRDPIIEFNSDGWNSLDRSVQKILKSHEEEIFNDGVTYQQQMKFVYTLIYSPKKSDHRGYQTIADLFGVGKGTVYNTIKRMEYKKKEVGHPPIFTQDELIFLANKIEFEWTNNNPFSLSFLANWIYKTFHKVISNNTLSHTIKRYKLGKSILAYPTEDRRICVPLEVIDQHYQQLQEILKARIPPAFVLNVDECGFQQWQDKRAEKVIVPCNVECSSTNIGIDRAGRRSTLVGCIAADGSRLKPFLIITRKTIEKSLHEKGYTDNVVEIVYQKSGFITAQIFDYWAESIFFPEIESRRLQYNYSGPVLLMYDGCTCHSSDFFLDECTYRDIIPFLEPPNSSDQVQVLDIGVFGVQKTLKKSLTADDSLSANSNEITAIVDSWMKATIPSNVTSAFRQAGFFKEEDSTFEYIVNCDIHKARSVRGIEHCENPLLIPAKKNIPVLQFE